MDHLVLALFASAALFIATGALLLFVTLSKPSRWSRIAAVCALLTISGAGATMMMSYGGEASIVLERAGPIVRRAIAKGERGYFEFVDEKSKAGDGADEAEPAPRSLLQRVLLADDTRKPERDRTHLKDCPHCPELVVVQPAYLRMGAPATDPDATAAERPTQVVRIDHPFEIGRSEVTVAQFLAFAKATGGAMPTCAGGDITDPRLPITCVTWAEAKDYVRWLSTTTDLRYNLPSEAEWEHAARAGSGDRYMTGHLLLPAAANVGAEGGRPEPVGRRAANGFGLHDLHGNVAEMVQDCWQASPAKLLGDGTPKAPRGSCTYRALRDAHAGEAASLARVSLRRPITPDMRHPGVGFRVMRELR